MILICLGSTFDFCYILHFLWSRIWRVITSKSLFFCKKEHFIRLLRCFIVKTEGIPRNQTGVFCTTGGFFPSWATREAHAYLRLCKKWLLLDWGQACSKAFNLNQCDVRLDYFPLVFRQVFHLGNKFFGGLMFWRPEPCSTARPTSLPDNPLICYKETHIGFLIKNLSQIWITQLPSNSTLKSVTWPDWVSSFLIYY